MTLTPDQYRWARKLRAALAAAETGPSGTNLAEAPHLNFWCPVVSAYGVPFLEGQVSDHPKLGNAWITTSQLIAIDLAKGWARTASRWYALARPFADYETQVARSLGMECAPPGFLQLTPSGLQPLEDARVLSRLLNMWAERIRRDDYDGG